MWILLPLEKMSKISDSARAILSSRTCSVRALARMIGLIVSSFRSVLTAILRYRSLEHLKLQTLEVSHGNFDVTLSLTPAVRCDLWAHSGHLHNGVSLRKPVHIVSFTTDASIWLGAIFEVQHTSGRWTPPEACMHINYLELLAVFFAVRSFIRSYDVRLIKVLCDNSTAVTYINNMGGMVPSLDGLTVQIWQNGALTTIA